MSRVASVTRPRFELGERRQRLIGLRFASKLALLSYISRLIVLQKHTIS